MLMYSVVMKNGFSKGSWRWRLDGGGNDGVKKTNLCNVTVFHSGSQFKKKCEKKTSALLVFHSGSQLKKKCEKKPQHCYGVS